MPRRSEDRAALRAAIYCRISDDRVGAGLGVARQREDCQRLVDERGWSAVGIYEDNDISAYAGRRRPGYEALLDKVRADQLDVVVAWHTDRLHRSPLELEDWIAACDPLGVGVVTVRAGEVDLSTAAGRMTARIVGAVARHESEQKSERISRKHRELALAGKPSGPMRAFGHNADGSINVGEAEIIRELASRTLAGESLKSVTRWLIAEHVPTVRGGMWRVATVRQMLTAARLSGQREWTPRRPEHGSSEGPSRRGYGMGEIVAQANWPAIIGKSETAQLRALFGDPARRTTPPGRPARYLLSGGLLRCGRCGGSMNSRSDPRAGRRYACIKQVGTTKCGAMSVIAEPVDQLVREMLHDALLSVDLAPQTTGGHDDEKQTQHEVDAAIERLTSLAQDYGDGLITRGEYLAARQRSEARLRESQLKQSTSGRRSVLEDVPTEQGLLRSQWEIWSLERRQAILMTVVERVVIAPATYPGRPTFDPDRVQVVWRL